MKEKLNFKGLGSWSGYEVTVKFNKEHYKLKVDKGVRGLGCACTVTVQNDKWSVKSSLGPMEVLSVVKSVWIDVK